MYYNSELLGTVNDLFDVNDRMGVELMGAAKWNGLKRAVVQYTGDQLLGWSVKNMAKSVANTGNGIVKKVSNAAKAISSKKIPYSTSSGEHLVINTFNVPAGAKQIQFLSGFDNLTRELFGPNDALGVELLGSKWYEKIGTGIKNATHSVLNAGSKIPYVSDAVSDVRSVANIFKKSSGANDSANAAISSVSDWIQANKIKTALILGGTGFVIYKLATRKKRK